MDEVRTDPGLRPPVLLERLYSRTRKALDGPPRQRSIVLQEGVDATIDDVDNLIRKGTTDALDALLSGMDVDKVHPELLDMIVALTEEMSVPSLAGFRDRVDGRLAQVDEVLRPIQLKRSDGSLVSHDVRKDARALYREKAKMFGDALREDGNLDKFYSSSRMRARGRGEDPGDPPPRVRRDDEQDDGSEELVLERTGEDGFAVVRRAGVKTRG